jgi:7-cyano-7-deazaguanine synthase
MDSFVSAAIAKSKGYGIYALTVNYGQKNKKEILSAIKVAKFLNAERHLIAKTDLSWTRSALTDLRIKIPQKIRQGEIPATYVPARNTIFISLALALAETVDADAIFTGVNAVDFSGYPDCRPEYIKRFQRLINSATKKTCGGGSIKLHAPLLRMSKAKIIKTGLSLGIDFSVTWSCYKSGKKPCGKCPSCIIRANGFTAAQIPDPA